MVVFPHNRHEVSIVRETWKSLGFDGCEFIPDNADQATPTNQARRLLAQDKKPCWWAWNTSVVGWDGTVEPCCQQRKEIPLGDARSDGLRSVWKSAAYERLRSGFDRKTYGETMNPVCRRCLGLSEEPEIGQLVTLGPKP
jgi:radical SAM protein with 4Fe4S-binding SPASM domain